MRILMALALMVAGVAQAAEGQMTTGRIGTRA
jgi:hypothetical protein